MPNKVTRIIIDTNLWISFLLTKDLSKLDEILFTKQVILVFSNELLEEFLEVIKRPKLRKHFTQNDIEDILETIEEYADFVLVSTEVSICRDPKDNFLLSLAKDGNADYLLTGDKDLLVLTNFENTKIISVSDFLKI
jgi:putative PIN family toxin of toxin-antitoxin system